MFKIYDGRESFYQWDIDRKLIINSNDIKEVHFCNCTDNESIVCETYEQDGQLLVNVPNVLLQEAWNINVYAYEGDDHTATSKLFIVIPRSKPADYVYTEEELKTWEGLEQRIVALEENSGLGGNTEELEEAIQELQKDCNKLDSRIDELVETIPTIPTNVSAFVNDAGYLTEHQDLGDYALKTEIPDVSGYALKTEIPDVSGFTTMSAVEGKGYQTADQVSALIADALGEVENGAY